MSRSSVQRRSKRRPTGEAKDQGGDAAAGYDSSEPHDDVAELLLSQADIDLLGSIRLRDDLRAMLGKARENFDRAPGNGEDRNDRHQLGCCLALRAVRGYLERDGIDPFLLEPLGQLMAAIADHNRGTANPLLRVARREGERGRPPARLNPNMEKARCAAAVTKLREGGQFDKREAIKWVLARVRNGAAFGARGVPKASALELFMKKLTDTKERAARTDPRRIKKTLVPAKNCYDRCLKVVAQFEPEAGAIAILDTLTRAG